MKLAFSTLACPAWSPTQVVENTLRFGYDGLELRLIDGKIIDPVYDAQKVQQMVALARTHGVEVCTLDTSCTFNHNSKEERDQNQESLRAWIRLAQDVEVPLLRVFGGQGKADAEPVPTSQEVDAWVIDALHGVAAEAEQAGVTVVLETHDAFSSARRVAGVLKTVNSPAIKALWDSHHPYRMGESAQDVMEVLDGNIGHVHIKDARRVAPDSHEWQLALLGDGEVPVNEQLALLHQHGYSGYASVEWEKCWHPEIADPEIALPQHAARLRRLPYFVTSPSIEQL